MNKNAIANFANGLFMFDADVRNNVSHLTNVSGYVFVTNEKSCDETDLHYLVATKPYIPEGEVVEPITIWSNLYGTYLRCMYKRKLYDILTSRIRVEMKEK